MQTIILRLKQTKRLYFTAFHTFGSSLSWNNHAMSVCIVLIAMQDKTDTLIGCITSHGVFPSSLATLDVGCLLTQLWIIYNIILSFCLHLIPANCFAAFLLINYGCLQNELSKPFFYVCRHGNWYDVIACRDFIHRLWKNWFDEEIILIVDEIILLMKHFRFFYMAPSSLLYVLIWIFNSNVELEKEILVAFQEPLG